MRIQPHAPNGGWRLSPVRQVKVRPKAGLPGTQRSGTRVPPSERQPGPRGLATWPLGQWRAPAGRDSVTRCGQRAIAATWRGPRAHERQRPWPASHGASGGAGKRGQRRVARPASHSADVARASREP